MKKTLPILSLIACLLFCIVSCTNPDDGDIQTVEPSTVTEVVVVTDEQGNNVTDEDGNDVTTQVVVTQAPGFNIQGVNTESGWGPLHRPN